MRTGCVVRHDRPRHELRVLWFDARVDMLAVIAVGPAVKAAVLHRGDVVGNEIAADLVALVDRRPQLTGARRPAQAVGIAQTRRKHAVLSASGIDLPDRSTSFFGGHAVLADIAV